ncbi:MAG TPA: amino-acid N-acetyltransferase [Fibrobacteraceae bacterium]|nr:amino-acid N-acetyltransferase [Fibrobacteraceae bacterium]
MDASEPKLELISTIREVFGYIARFKGQLFILKIEDVLLDHPLFPVLIRDIAQLQKIGIRVLIVPGTRRSIDQKLATYGVDSEFHQSIRLTSKKAMPIVELASIGVAETLLSYLTANGCKGVQGNWIQARSLGIVDGVDYQSTGRIERIHTDILQHLLDDGFIPIVPPIGWNKLGHPYNVSSTELATALCSNLQVGKLFFIGLEEGIRADGLSRGELTQNLELNAWGIISALDVHQAQELLNLNQDKLPFALQDYLNNAIQACACGAKRVHLVSGLTQGAILHEVFSSRGDGTMVYTNQYSSIQPATTDDVPDILRIMQDYIEKGFLIPRTAQDITDHIDEYVVYVVDNTILGCGALINWGDGFGEIAAIAVDANYRLSGVGEVIVRSLLVQAPVRGFQHVFLLTTQATDWFYTLGFRDGQLDELPTAKREKYDHKRNSRILILRK